MPRTKRPALRLSPPTAAQLACQHRWRVINTQRSYRWWWSPWPRTRYVRCLRCQLRVRTVEQLEVPWATEVQR
jgi:hypothetical protein